MLMIMMMITCPLCKVEPEDNFHVVLSCNIMKPEWDKFWEKLLSIVEVNCRQECNVLTHFLKNFDHYFIVLLLSGCLKLVVLGGEIFPDSSKIGRIVLFSSRIDCSDSKIDCTYCLLYCFR